MSLKQHLEKRKRGGIIDFIEVSLDWGLLNKEFIVYSFEHKEFCRIFFDNKYRQDTFTPKIENIEKKLQVLLKESSGNGIFCLAEEIKNENKILDFYEKYM